jgi:starch synthase
MPRYGNINERRHQLHEVIRLGDEFGSNDLDMPLIIKVASIPKREYRFILLTMMSIKRKAIAC